MNMRLTYAYGGEAATSEDETTSCVFTATAPSLVASGCAALIDGEEACTAAWPSRRDMAACGAACGLTPAALRSSEFMNAARCTALPETCLDANVDGLSCVYTAGDEASCTGTMSFGVDVPCVYTAAVPAVDPVAAVPPACRDVASSADVVVDCAAAPDGFDQAACEAAASADASRGCVYEAAVAPCSAGDYVPPMLCDFSYANLATTAQEGYAVDVPFKIDMDITDNADGTYLVWGVGTHQYWRS